MQWVTPRHDMSPFVSESADGYYRVGHCDQASLTYGAFHVEAVWARPREIGRKDSITEAQNVCEQHAADASAALAKKGAK